MLSVLLPSVAEEESITHILSTLDDKIELNRRMNETLEAMARTLFKSWFVNFDPVRNKAERRGPKLPSSLVDLFPTEFEASELGEIPKGWSVGTILTKARLLSGGTPKTENQDYWDGSIAWASAKDVSQCADRFLIVTERTITDKGLEESATQLIPAFATVVVARGATTGRMVLFGRDMAMNQTCYALVSRTKTPFALYCQLFEGIGDLVHAAHGSVFDTITTSTFNTGRFILAADSALEAFEKLVSPMFKRILKNCEESRTLAATRDTLLPKLISGELRVKDAKKRVEALV
jgi:type I restriction enzyme S subunit